ncbi:DUF2188 domain-containing protein [Cupriavidus pampae]|uniref:DUF2188 domain-containing protein n=1 Tax=Cupriavidus pampae TaxID=659251 RepID=A0ABM8XW42_9BURK|nr:DUF2188 domain-containing protein [Cupriavidus pampae]CAG9184631.1 hypothetical protein LMG32289_05672 [Cupriavidus pampae]
MPLHIQVTPYKGGWDVIHEGARYADSHHPTREAAVLAGATLARQEKTTLVTYDITGEECTRLDYTTVAAGAVV